MSSIASDASADSNSGEDSWEDLPQSLKSPRKLALRNSEILRTRPATRSRRIRPDAYPSSPKRTRTAQPRPIGTPTRPARNTSEDVKNFIWSLLGYTVDVLSTAIHLLRKPLSFLLFLWFLALILAKVSSILQAAFQPLCILPGISSLYACNPQTNTSAVQWADYPRLVEVQSKTFEQVLDSSAGGSSLSLDVKKAEMASSDLITLVRVSGLNSRDLLADALAEFVKDARKTARGLQRLSSKVQGSVDQIVAVNDYALHAIEGSSPSSSFLAVLNPFPPSSRSRDIVTQTFQETLTVLSTSVQRLTLESHAQHLNLEKLEEHLALIHSILTREKSSLTLSQSEVLSELWTMLGGNKKTLKRFEGNLGLLRNLEGTRREALARVVAVSQALDALGEDLEELRERVSRPEMVGEGVPLEVQVRSIKIGVERLRQGRSRARDLEDDERERLLGAAL